MTTYYLIKSKKGHEALIATYLNRKLFKQVSDKYMEATLSEKIEKITRINKKMYEQRYKGQKTVVYDIPFARGKTIKVKP